MAAVRTESARSPDAELIGRRLIHAKTAGPCGELACACAHHRTTHVPLRRLSGPGDPRRRAAHPGPGRLRFCLVSERRRFPSSRRRREPLVGRVGRRTRAGTRASRRIAARRCLAAVRLRRCERCSAALTVSTVPESLPESRSRTSSRWVSLSAVVVPRSRESCTRESEVLTPWPPGPEAWENCSTSSPAGTLRPRGAPGPGGTCRSSTR